MRKALTALAMLPLLTAGMCSTTREVLVPVPQRCVTGELPAEPEKVSDKLTGDSGADIGIIAGSAIELRAWGRALYGIASACKDSTLGASLQPLGE